MERKHDDNQIGQAGAGNSPGPLRDLFRYHTPKLALAMSIYHAVVLVASLVVTTFIVPPDTLIAGCATTGAPTAGEAIGHGCHLVHQNLLIFAFSFGVLGSTLVASRYVVLAVRHRKYDSHRILWQLMTPMHGGVLACAAIYVVLGGLLMLSRSGTPGDQYGYFVGGFAFLVGFSSELFVKRLIRATEALFGELANIDELLQGIRS